MDKIEIEDIKRLNITDGDIIVIKFNAIVPLSHIEDTVRTIQTVFKQGNKNVRALILDKTVDFMGVISKEMIKDEYLDRDILDTWDS